MSSLMKSMHTLQAVTLNCTFFCDNFDLVISNVIYFEFLDMCVHNFEKYLLQTGESNVTFLIYLFYIYLSTKRLIVDFTQLF